ncbi:MAG: hypothetical protein ABIN01_19060 [Ferruginibacter sp.]
MKKHLQINPVFLRTVVLFASFMLAIVYNKSKAADVPAILHTSAKVVVNFKHDIAKDELRISIKSSTEVIMQLFIFSPDGILIKEVAVSANKITTIKGLQKGYYQYECFDNDERMKSGSLMIK